MRIVESSIEQYQDNLKILIEELNPSYVLGGWTAVHILKENKLLENYKIVHGSHFDDIALTGIFDPSTRVPVTSYNIIFFNGLKIIGQIYLDPKLVWDKVLDDSRKVNVYIDKNDIFDLSNDLLDNRGNYKEIKLEDNKVETAREFSKLTKHPLICVVDSINNIKEQLLEEYNNLPDKWKKVAKRPSGHDYAHYTVRDKIYNNTYIIHPYNAEIVFVEEKDIEDVSNKG